MAQLQRVIHSVLLIKEKYESPYEVYPPESHLYIHHSLLWQETAAKLAVD